MQIVRYTRDKSQEWDQLVKESKNGTFLFLRDYMDYHADRFQDHSLMYYSDKGRLLAVMAANEKLAVPSVSTARDHRSAVGEVQKILYSHQGLTYGGFVLSSHIHAAEVGELFSLTLSHLRTQGFTEWYYKQIPTIYHRLPAEEEDYWLWMHQAQLVDCSLMTVIPLHPANSHLPTPSQHPLCNLVSASKRNNSNRLLHQGYRVVYSAPIADFWPILTQNLQDRFGAKPVHTFDEISLLQQRFPQQIQCCTVVSPTGEILAGTLLYLTDQVVKAQYTSASPVGKQVKALDFLILQLLHHFQETTSLQYFDFGTSMLADTTTLNEGLVLQKEGFGGRGIASRIYKMQCACPC